MPKASHNTFTVENQSSLGDPLRIEATIPRGIEGALQSEIHSTRPGIHREKLFSDDELFERAGSCDPFGVGNLFSSMFYKYEMPPASGGTRDFT